MEPEDVDVALVVWVGSLMGLLLLCGVINGIKRIGGEFFGDKG